MPHFKFILLGLLTGWLLLTGCDLTAIKGQQQQAENFCQLSGEVKSEGAIVGNLIVILFHHKGGPVEQKSEVPFILRPPRVT